MEILAVQPLAELSRWFIPLILMGIGFAIYGIIAYTNKETRIFGVICLIIAFICGIVVNVFPMRRPANQYKYTIEITDQNKYQELIDKNYVFTKLYENREIYNIVGDELK